jgi:hypothetical protein
MDVSFGDRGRNGRLGLSWTWGVCGFSTAREREREMGR